MEWTTILRLYRIWIRPIRAVSLFRKVLCLLAIISKISSSTNSITCSWEPCRWTITVTTISRLQVVLTKSTIFKSNPFQLINVELALQQTLFKLKLLCIPMELLVRQLLTYPWELFSTQDLLTVKTRLSLVKQASFLEKKPNSHLISWFPSTWLKSIRQVVAPQHRSNNRAVVTMRMLLGRQGTQGLGALRSLQVFFLVPSACRCPTISSRLCHNRRHLLAGTQCMDLLLSNLWMGRKGVDSPPATSSY